jgi:non-heme chloroperoxidase
MTTHPDLINADILAFIRDEAGSPTEARNAEPALA